MKMYSSKFVAVGLLVSVAFASNVTSIVDFNSGIDAVIVSAGAADDKQGTFQRSQEQHEHSMGEIMKNMTSEHAMAILRANPKTTPALLELAGSMTESAGSLRGHLRAKQNPNVPAGYKGAQKARDLLNEMISESMENYDLEIAKCTNYYSEQCGLMESCRGEISAANYKAAVSRQHILAAQTQVAISQEALPRLRDELEQHNLKCEHEIQLLNQRIKVVSGDIAIMTAILEMTDCDAKGSLVQTEALGLLHCKDHCGRSFVSFSNRTIRDSISQLQSDHSKALLKDAFADLLLSGDQDTVELVQSKHGKKGKRGKPQQSKFNNPPVPRTKVPGNPCNDKNAGAPSDDIDGCSISRSPQCYKLQGRFLQIQGGVIDDRDLLKETLSMLEHNCEETKLTITTDIQNEDKMLKEEETKLAEATAEESNAGEKARVVAKMHDDLEKGMQGMMAQCNTNYVNFETEQCGLKKIRGELAKLVGTHSGSKPPFFQDCRLTKWEPGECSKKCAGGSMTLTRNIATQPDGGAKCLPLESKRRCNDHPCPIDCKLQPWTQWSRCSAECGGGVTQRLRDVSQLMKHDGQPCDETSETKVCNPQACEKDCELTKWSKWSKCSKMCDGGTKKRQRYIKAKALGGGKCAGGWSEDRLEYKRCNMKKCVKDDTVLQCESKVDVVLVLDGSGSIGQKGWKATKDFAKAFTEAFSGKNASVEIAILLYSGPRTWSGVGKCMGLTKSNEPVDLDKTCKIHWVQHFSADMSQTRANIDSAQWPRGSTLTSLALGTASNELNLGRKDATPIVLLVTDGKPLSFKRTEDAALNIRKLARLMFVPVTRWVPMKSIRRWATPRWQENIVKVKNYHQLALSQTIDHIIADMCPKLEKVPLPPADAYFSSR